MILHTSLGRQSLKVSKYFRLSPSYIPAEQDAVLIKIFRKVKSGQEKLKAFEMRPLNADELSEFNQQLVPLSDHREAFELMFCQSKACVKRGARKLMEEVSRESQQSDLNLQVGASSCLGQCKFGPAAECSASGKVVTQLTPSKVKALILEASSN